MFGYFREPSVIWGFTIIWDPDRPQIVGFPSNQDPKKVKSKLDVVSGFVPAAPGASSCCVHT